jgi:hypothetical protein
VSGPGGPRTDSIPAWLSNGEYVVNAQAAAMWGPILEAINSGRGYANGGPVVGTPVNRSETINIGVMQAHDYHDFRDQLDREKALAQMPGVRG